MGARALFTPATTEHARALARTLRPEDTAELVAFGLMEEGGDLEEVLVHCLDTSAVAFAGLVGEEVACLFGVAPIPDVEAGQIWFLTGEAFRRHPRGFVRAARAVIGELLHHWPGLGNYIDARYSAAVRWAKWLGFQVEAPVRFGPRGQLCHPAHIWRSSWVQ